MFDKTTWKKVVDDNSDFFNVVSIVGRAVVFFTLWIVPSWLLGEALTAFTELSTGLVAVVVSAFLVIWGAMLILARLYQLSRAELIREARYKLERDAQPKPKYNW